jgi:hypothetical protein
MRLFCTPVLIALGLAILAGSADAQKDRPKEKDKDKGKPKFKVIKPEREWVDVAADDKLMKEAPKDGIIVDAKAFEKLWKAWRKDEKVPKIDFDKNLVVVTLAVGGPNKPRCTARLGEDGDLKILAISTKLGGDGFGYSIGVYEKAGIKKVNGNDVPRE